MEKKKKPYEKPGLKGKIVFEAAGAQTCCKTVALACTGGGRSNLAKTVQNKEVS